MKIIGKVFGDITYDFNAKDWMMSMLLGVLGYLLVVYYIL